MNNTLVYLQNDIENRAGDPFHFFFIIGAFHLFRIVDSALTHFYILKKLNDVFIEVIFS